MKSIIELGSFSDKTSPRSVLDYIHFLHSKTWQCILLADSATFSLFYPAQLAFVIDSLLFNEHHTCNHVKVFFNDAFMHVHQD